MQNVSESLVQLTHDDVTLRVPAAAAYVSLIRTAAASLAARLDIPVDRIDDLRLAVDEACSLLLVHGESGAHLEFEFQLFPPDSLRILAHTLSNGSPLKTGGFAWTVLSALVSDVEIELANALVTISMTLDAQVTP